MLIRKVQTRERAEELLGGCVVGPRRFLFGSEVTQRNFFIRGNLNNGAPRIFTIGEAHAPVSRRAQWVSGLPNVFLISAEAQIAAPVIESIVVDVVNVETRWSIHNNSMDQLHLGGDNVPQPTLSFGRSEPEAFEVLVVGGIHQGDKTALKRNPNYFHEAPP